MHWRCRQRCCAFWRCAASRWRGSRWVKLDVKPTAAFGLKLPLRGLPWILQYCLDFHWTPYQRHAVVSFSFQESLRTYIVCVCHIHHAANKAKSAPGRRQKGTETTKKSSHSRQPTHNFLPKSLKEPRLVSSHPSQAHPSAERSRQKQSSKETSLS